MLLGAIIICSVLFAQVWQIMTSPDMLLDWVPNLIPEDGPMQKVRKLITCSVCMAGQIAFWSYLFIAECYVLLDHSLVVAAAIWIANLTRNIHD